MQSKYAGAQADTPVSNNDYQQGILIIRGASRRVRTRPLQSCVRQQTASLDHFSVKTLRENVKSIHINKAKKGLSDAVGTFHLTLHGQAGGLGGSCKRTSDRVLTVVRTGGMSCHPISTCRQAARTTRRYGFPDHRRNDGSPIHF